MNWIVFFYYVLPLIYSTFHFKRMNFAISELEQRGMKSWWLTVSCNLFVSQFKLFTCSMFSFPLYLSDLQFIVIVIQRWTAARKHVKYLTFLKTKIIIDSTFVFMCSGTSQSLIIMIDRFKSHHTWTNLKGIVRKMVETVVGRELKAFAQQNWRIDCVCRIWKK